MSAMTTTGLWDSLSALRDQALAAYPSDKRERERHLGASVAELMRDAEHYAAGREAGERYVADRLGPLRERAA